MPSDIEHEWLLAETLAWPLVSEEAFDSRTTALRLRHPGVPDEPTQRLADALDAWLRPRARGWSLEALRALREAIWFDRGAPFPSLDACVIHHAGQLLCFAGTRIELRQDQARSYEAQVNRWHWLCRAVPADLLIAACGCHEGIEPTCDHVHVASPDLARLLEREVAETHLHVGAAVPFPVLWTGIMRAVEQLDEHDRDHKLTRGGPPPFGTSEAFVSRLAVAAIARWVMAAFLHWRRTTGQHGSFGEFCARPLECLSQRAMWPSGPEAFRRMVLRTLATIWGGTEVVDIALIKTTYRHLRMLDERPAPDSDQDMAARDPVSWLLPVPGSGVLPETRFAHHALCYLQGPGRTDPSFRGLFWQYQRIRGRCFRHLVHEPGTQGLDWFGKHFGRIAALRRTVEEQIYRIALDCQSRGLQLASFEARTSPDTSWNQCWRQVRDYARQARAWLEERPHRRTQMGLVFHFTKEARSSCGRLHADPRQAAFSGRYGTWFFQAQQRADAIAMLLEHVPACLLLLRGVDIANVELAIPTWVTVGLFRRLRRESGKAARTLARRWPGLDIEPLRVTYHAGEEFRRLGEGLRRIHELIESGILQRGDRIGHGLALGTCPEALARTRRVALQPMEERLDDLLWEWERYARAEVQPPPGRETYVRAEIHRLARTIHDQDAGSRASPAVEDLVDARALRHNPVVLSRYGYPRCDRPPITDSSAHRLLWRHLTDAGVFERGQVVEEVELTDLEVASLQRLQSWLRARVAALALTIESNPTSNLLIGDLVEIATHPSFVLQPLGPSREGPIPLSINTDNPLTFSTCLADEYTYLHAALLRSNAASSQDAIEWLERARQAAWSSRFTHPASAEAHSLRAVERALQR